MYGQEQIIAAQVRALALQGRVGASKVYTFPLPAVGAGQTSPPQTVTFRRNGLVTALYGQPSDGAVASYAGLSIRLTAGASEDLFTDGNTFQYVPMLALFGLSTPWFPLMRRISASGTFSCSIRNATGGALTPSVCLAVLEDPT